MPISKTAGGHSNQYRARRPLSSASSMHSDAHCSPLRCSSTLQSVTLRAPAVNSLGTRYQLAAHKLNQSPHTLAKTPKAPVCPYDAKFGSRRDFRRGAPRAAHRALLAELVGTSAKRACGSVPGDLGGSVGSSHRFRTHAQAGMYPRCRFRVRIMIMPVTGDVLPRENENSLPAQCLHKLAIIFVFLHPPPRRRLTSTGKQLTMDESTFLFTSESVSEGHPGIAYND